MNNEQTKRDRFIRIAEKRTNRILETLNLLGNCSNKNNYSYTDDDIKVIFNTIEAQLKKTKKKFTDDNQISKFTLK